MLFALSGCGSGVGAVLSNSSGGEDGVQDQAPFAADVVALGDAKSSPLTFEFRLGDAESDPTAVEYWLLPPGGAAPQPLALAGGPDPGPLATSPSGVVYARAWDFASQLPGGAAYATGMRIAVRPVGSGVQSQSPPLEVGNDAPQLSGLVTPGGELVGVVPVALVVADSSSDTVDLRVEYQTLLGGASWFTATLIGSSHTNLAATPTGVGVLVLWDALADVGAIEVVSRLRFIADDGHDASTPLVTPDLVLDNNAAPVALLNGSAFVGTQDLRRGVPVPIALSDAEGDAVQVVVQWRGPFGTFPDLPASPADLPAILADPLLRRQHQIAAEAPHVHRGTGLTTSASTFRVPDLASSEPSLVGALPGRRIGLLRPRGAPRSGLFGWGASALQAPVAALAFRDGDTALVLDEPVSGTWRVQEVDLATGVVVRHVAGGSGSPAMMVPEGLDPENDPSTAVVASVSAGLWSLSRIDVVDGGGTLLGTTAGVLATGPPTGLAARGPDTFLVTVADALIEVDTATPGSLSETLLLAGLATPSGLVLEPARNDRVLVAERDWLDPGSGQPDGRVVAIDLTTLERTTVVATGVPLLHPGALALEQGGARLLVLTDANPLDGARELRGVDLRDGDGFELAAGLPDDAQGLATGPEHLRLLAAPAGDDLWFAGGLEQEREVLAYDAAQQVLSLGAALDPVPTGRRAFRIVRAETWMPAGWGTLTGTYVFDADALRGAGEVVLRAVPYDSEQGQPVDTGIPRSLLSPIDVEAEFVGGLASTPDVQDLVLADLDGDGDLDLATANAAADTITIFLQGAPGDFPGTPSSTHSGVAILAPMNEPVALEAIDVDGDGDLDLVSANRSSNNFSVLRQGAPGSFTTELLHLGLGSNAPEDVAAGDVTGDGRIDLVAANTGADNVLVFPQLLLGLFSPLPTSTLGSAATLAPSSVAVADLDGDGDLDIASANRDSDNAALFLQTLPGVFPAAPAQVLGNAVDTAGARSIAAGDLDGNGTADLVTANELGNDLAVFLRPAGGAFPVAPDASLSALPSLVGARDVRLADVDGDGVLDVVAPSASGNVTAFNYDPLAGGFVPHQVTVGQDELSTPQRLAVGDVDGDGLSDVAVADSDADRIVLFRQRGGGTYAATPDLQRGNAFDTPAAESLAVADLDADGFLDLVVGNPGDGSLTLYRQFSPTVIPQQAWQRIGPSPSLAGVRDVVAGDLDGDGDLDLACVSQAAGVLAVFLCGATGGFASTPDLALGPGLGAPVALAVADFDGDGDLDLACADQASSSVSVFLQSAPGVFPVGPDATLGGAPQLAGVSDLLAVDLDDDGDLDLVTANATAGTLAVFLQSAPGVFPVAPSQELGGAGSAGARAVVAADLEGDGDLDLISANGTGNSLTVFLQLAPGVFAAAPSLTVTHASLSGPLSLDAADLDLDGDVDLIASSAGADALLVFEQRAPGVFASEPTLLGGPATTPDARSVRAVDLDGDGDPDLLCCVPSLHVAAAFYGSH